MTVGIIIQSRMGSSRFPGKSLATIGDKSLLNILVSTISIFFEKENIIVATSTNPENKAIEEICNQLEISCFRGHEEDVASRYKTILQEKEFSHFFRICGDSPFFLPKLIQQSIQEIEKNPEADFVSTMPTRAHPQGQNIELFNSKTFLRDYNEFSEKPHFEHVTKFFYENHKKYNHVLLPSSIKNFNYEDTKFSVDVKKDLQDMRKLYDVMDKPHYLYSLEELYHLHKKYI